MEKPKPRDDVAGSNRSSIGGKLVDIIGDDVGEPGSITVALCGYGSQVPRVIGTAAIAHPTSEPIQADQNGGFTSELWGNDYILPPGTFYTITVRDENGDIVQCNAYVFLGGIEYDIGTADPFDPSLPIPPLPPLIYNQLLIVPYDPNPTFPGDEYLSLMMTLTGDVDGSTCTGMVQGNLYTFIIQQDSTGGWNFAWPPQCSGATPVNPEPGSLTIQTFVAIGANGPLYSIGPGSYYP